MKREEHKAIINNLLGMIAPEHQADATEALTQLSDDYETVLNDSEEHRISAETLKDRNEKLRAVNAELFLKVGTHEKKDPEKKEPEKTEPLPFDSLFDEKGELK